jgi:hypothetical protein
MAVTTGTASMADLFLLLVPFQPLFLCQVQLLALMAITDVPVVLDRLEAPGDLLH